MRLKVAVDCDISPRLAAVLGGLFGDDGFEFQPVEDLVPPGTEDEHWADVFKRFGGSVVLSADTKIAFKPHKAIAFIDNGFISFFMQHPWQLMKGQIQAAHLIYWWPIIAAKIAQEERGTCWRAPCVAKLIDGKYRELRLKPEEFDPLRIPDHVLQKAREERNAARAVQASGKGTGKPANRKAVRQAAEAHSPAPAKARGNGRQQRLKGI